WLRIVFLGGKRSDAEVSYVLENMKSITDMEHVLKTNGEDLQIEMSKLLSRGIAAEKDEYLNEMLKEMQNEVFRIVASVKGSARYFQKNKVSKKWLDDKTGTKDKTWELIEELVEDGDVSNIKWTKVILWFHAVGKAPDFCPPSRQVKDFVNKDIGPYYRFYEDDKYFMKQMDIITEEARKTVKAATVRDISRAAFYYRCMKGMFGGNPKLFTPKFLMLFMKKNKLTLDKLADMLADIKKKNKLFKMLNPE
ncbi:MAG TPA: hypothetical protein VI968_00670, partial [archaeon]|nr:hypothetical protein [archaeon]